MCYTIAYLFHYFCKPCALTLFGQMLTGLELKLISLQEIDKIFYHIPFSFIGLLIRVSSHNFLNIKKQ